MKKEEYDKALDGLKSMPQRHYVIGGVQPHSVNELNELARQRGYDPDAEKVVKPPSRPDPVSIAPPTQATQAVEKPKPDIQTKGSKPASPAKADSAKGAEAKAPKAPKGPKAPKEDQQPKAAEKTAKSAEGAAAVVIPENLMTLKLAELKTLAKELGIDPIPAAQPELLAAIEAKRV